MVIAAGHNITLINVPAGATVKSFTVSGQLNLYGKTLTVNGNVVNNGTIISSQSTSLNINGSSCGAKATLIGTGFFATQGTITITVVNVDTSGFTGGVGGDIVVNGTGTART